MLPENIIQHLATQISTCTDKQTKIKRISAVAGGDICQSFLIETHNKKYFLKLSEHNAKALFKAEAFGLNSIAETAVIRTPKVICEGSFEQYQYLILEYLELRRNGDVKLLAKALANLHLTTREQFGFQQDNFIGLTPQTNTWETDWVYFFAEHRLKYQLQLLTNKGVPNRLLKSGSELIGLIPHFFDDYCPQASFIHGDLWSGNYAFDENGFPVIYDPACYYADHEAELAMMELFGSPGESFFSAYHDIFKIDSGYSRRKPLYNLYHLLNHANIFGGGYINQSLSCIHSLLKSF
ncbi:fructosamine kinase family protein [Aliikangiella sp. IMCC44359]|uniref:fructosamine kinase family protein n=1 Tax=Aliikangiella sp. IMCC44359 TaxID=3459125 RepID=UPI00403AD4CA